MAQPPQRDLFDQADQVVEQAVNVRGGIGHAAEREIALQPLHQLAELLLQLGFGGARDVHEHLADGFSDCLDEVEVHVRDLVEQSFEGAGGAVEKGTGIERRQIRGEAA